jgi:hypothetical protein
MNQRNVYHRTEKSEIGDLVRFEPEDIACAESEIEEYESEPRAVVCRYEI